MIGLAGAMVAGKMEMPSMGKISPETIQQIAAANDIVEVIGGYFPLKRMGSRFRALCPFHQEKTPSFNVNPTMQRYHCFGCGADGDVIGFVMKYENSDFPAAVRKLADRAGIPIEETVFTEEEDRRQKMRRRILALHQEAAEWFNRNLRQSASAEGAREYLKTRRITAEIAREWKLGYAPDSWDAFSEWARGQGYEREELAQSGLVKLRDEDQPGGEFYDRFRDRLMFPICNDQGEVVAFSGRVLKSDAKEAKYVNSPETMLFTKGNILFGLHRTKRALIDRNSAIVCEGQLDLISAFQAGVQNMIAPQGTAFTEKQARILRRYAEEVVLCFDSDAAGQKATERSLPALLDANFFVRVAELPAGHDPDSLIREQGPEAFLERIAAARDFFDYQIDRELRSEEFGTPQGKVRFARKMAGWAALISDPFMLDAVISKTALRLEIPAEEFRKLAAGNRPADKKGGRSEAVKAEGGQAARLQPRNTVRLLCGLALRSTKGRAAILRHAGWRDLLLADAEGEIAVRILEAPIQPEDPHSVAAWMSRLGSEESGFISELLREKLRPSETEVAAACLGELEALQMTRRREAIRARIKQTNLAPEEVEKLQKEVLDLQQRLNDIARPLTCSEES